MAGHLSSIQSAFLTQYFNCLFSCYICGKYADNVENKIFFGSRLNGRAHLCLRIIAYVSTSVAILVTFSWKYVQYLIYFWQYEVATIERVKRKLNWIPPSMGFCLFNKIRRSKASLCNRSEFFDYYCIFTT
jgi:hypothetical protein